MASGRGGIIGGIITLAIGGVVYSVSQTAIVQNFSKDTGMSQQESEQYVKNISKDDLVSYDVLGSDMVKDGQGILSNASDLDCDNYTYKWVSNTLSCEDGKSQLITVGNSEIALGNAYTVLASKTASTDDISTVIRLIDSLNTNYNLEVVGQVLDQSTIDEARKTNSYNKAVLQAALDSK